MCSLIFIPTVPLQNGYSFTNIDIYSLLVVLSQEIYLPCGKSIPVASRHNSHCVYVIDIMPIMIECELMLFRDVRRLIVVQELY